MSRVLILSVNCISFTGLWTTGKTNQPTDMEGITLHCMILEGRTEVYFPKARKCFGVARLSNAQYVLKITNTHDVGISCFIFISTLYLYKALFFFLLKESSTKFCRCTKMLMKIINIYKYIYVYWIILLLFTSFWLLVSHHESTVESNPMFFEAACSGIHFFRGSYSNKI